MEVKDFREKIDEAVNTKIQKEDKFSSLNILSALSFPLLEYSIPFWENFNKTPLYHAIGAITSIPIQAARYHWQKKNS